VTCAWPRVRTERDEMTSGRCRTVLALLKRANRERMAQVVNARAPLARAGFQASRSDQAQEYPLHRVRFFAVLSG
jgi:hypothetical protein